MSTDQQEKGEPTQWDVAWREGYAKGLEATLGIGYREAFLRAAKYWQPRSGRRTQIARWLLRW
jgi:hypothetical protein